VDTVRRRASEAATETTADRSRDKSADAKKPEPPKKERRKRKFPYRKTADIEADILDRETQIEDLQGKLLLPETLRDGRLVKQTQTDIERLREELQKLY